METRKKIRKVITNIQWSPRSWSTYKRWMALRWVRPTTNRWSRWFPRPSPSRFQNVSVPASAWSTAERSHLGKCGAHWRSTRDQELDPLPSSTGNASWAAHLSTSSAKASRRLVRHIKERWFFWLDQASANFFHQWKSIWGSLCWACTQEVSKVTLNKDDWGLEWSLTLLFEVADEVWLGAEAPEELVRHVAALLGAHQLLLLLLEIVHI